MIKDFKIFKNNYKKADHQPDYRIYLSEKGQELTEIGGCWLAQSEKGTKYFNCKLNDIYVDNVKGVAKKGFVIQEEGMTAHAKSMPAMNEVDTDEIPF